MAGLGILLVGALASSTLLIRVREEAVTVEDSPQLGVGYYLKDATLSGTGDDGRILYRISAETVTQAPDDGSVGMENVHVNYDPATETPWSLKADTGKMLAGGKMLELSGNVVATTLDASSPAATITTDYLEFDPSTDTAVTESKVVIRYGGSLVNATGLRAMLRQDRLELLANVTGRYVR